MPSDGFASLVAPCTVARWGMLQLKRLPNLVVLFSMRPGGLAQLRRHHFDVLLQRLGEMLRNRAFNCFGAVFERFVALALRQQGWVNVFPNRHKSSEREVLLRRRGLARLYRGCLRSGRGKFVPAEIFRIVFGTFPEVRRL